MSSYVALTDVTLLFHSTKNWKLLLFSRMVQRQLRASLLTVESHFSINSRSTCRPSMSKKWASERRFPKIALVRQSSTAMVKVVELPD